MADIRAVVRNYILTEALPGESPENLKDDALLASGILDSIRVVKLVDVLEKEFEIEISPDDLGQGNFDCVDSIVAFVERRRAAAR